jgi:quinohemoprotein ethanol dehydrogenase
MGTSAGADARVLGGYSIDSRTQRKRVLTFMLDGTASLPPPLPPFRVQAPPDPGYVFDPSQAAKGAPIYDRYCTGCHGIDMFAAGIAPDLRGSRIPQSAEAFDSIVRGGALVANGMPRFHELADRDILSLRQYIRSRAHDLRTGKEEP